MQKGYEMKEYVCFVLIVFVCLANSSQALECSMLKTSNDDFHKVLTTCVKNSTVLAKFMEYTKMSSSSESSSSESDSEEDGENDARIVRMHRSAPVYKSLIQESSTQTVETTTMDDKNKMDDNQTCIIHCILGNFGMLNGNSYPDHSKFADTLLKSTNEREFKDFLQDTTDECFQKMDEEDSMEPCIYSSKLVACLAEKGKNNCADWPVADLPFPY